MNSSTRQKIGLANSWLLVALIFFLPISTSISAALALLIVPVWLIEGDFPRKFTELRANPLAYVLLAYTALFAIGLLWSADLAWGLKQTTKQWKLLLFLPLLSVSRREHYPLYFGAFLAAMTLSATLSTLIWLELIRFKNVMPQYPIPFNSHISYNPLLALALYLLLHTLFFKRPSRKLLILMLPAGLLLTGSMFITTGRTGQAAFFVLLFLLVFQYFQKRRAVVLGIAIGLLVLPVLLVTAYQVGPGFKLRTDEAIADLAGDYRNKPTSSTAQRLTFAINSFELFQDSPWFGVGTGDFPTEYRKINAVNSAAFPSTDDPHNHYLLVLCQFGLFGFLIFCALFLLLFRGVIGNKDDFTDFRLAFILFYLTIMLGGTYLLGHELALCFAIFGALLYGGSSKLRSEPT